MAGTPSLSTTVATLRVPRLSPPRINHSPKEIEVISTFEAVLRADAENSSADVSGIHSIHLTGITFADGSTPDSHGYEIVDVTGIPSPNVAVGVPEPPTLPIAAIGAALIVAFRLSKLPIVLGT